jgi:hypothetical protein
MAFVPRIDVLQTSCNKIKIIEKTNPYSSTTNTTGWGTPNIDTDEVTDAVLYIYPYSTSTTPNAVSTNGTIIGTLFTDTTHTSGVFAVGQLLTGIGVQPGTRIVAVITGTGSNNGGTYIVNISQNVTATTINGYSIADAIVIKNTIDIDLYQYTVGYPTPSEFTLLQDVPWTNPDGIYRIVYNVFFENQVFTNPTQHTLFLCNLCACKDKLVQKLIKSCSTPNTEKLKTQVDQMEIFIYGIQSAYSCKDFTTVNKLLTEASTYCETIANCGCGCNGC